MNDSKMDVQRRLELRFKPNQSNFEDVALPDSIPDIPGQVSLGEARFLYWLISQTYTGMGSVVEIGTWLGRSTAHLAAGIRDSQQGGKIHSYDLFIWGGRGDNSKSGLNLASQSDFMPYFLEYIAPLKEFVLPVRADFSTIHWNKGQPVEILFLDAPKSAAHFQAAMNNFTGTLDVGRSMLVMQDYQHPLSFELPLIVWALKEHLSLVHAVSSGGTASFSIKREIGSDDLNTAYHLQKNIAQDQAPVVWEEILKPLSGDVRNRMSLAAALHLYALGATDDSLKTFHSIQLDERMRAGLTSWSKIEKLRLKYLGLFEEFSKL